MNDLIKIALIDDEALFLEGLSLLFSKTENINVITTASSGLQFIDYLSTASSDSFPDIALVDIQMTPMDGFELVENLKSTFPDLKIIILSSHYKNNLLGHMMKLGVSAFVPKNATKELLIEAIESVRISGVYFTQKNHQMLRSYMNDKSKQPTLQALEELSSRETEVLTLICQEYTNQEIAEKLFLSKRTVESHRQRVLEKIGAKNTVGAVVYAIANGIHTLPEELLSL